MIKNSKPIWWNKACSDLSENDIIMKNLILKFPDNFLTSVKNPFFSLSRSIVGQQISVQAADSIWLRIQNNFNVNDAGCYKKVNIKDLRSLGLSERKANYLKNISIYMDGVNNYDYWASLDDKVIHKKLINIKGIGPWSIKMFLIFSLNRPDIFSTEDIGLINAIGKNYFNSKKPNLETVESLSNAWKPWRTVASWYLWRSIDPSIVCY